MKYAVIDDQTRELDSITSLIQSYSDENNHSSYIRQYSSGEAFLEEFTAFSYDIIFVDIYMNGINGIDTVKHIRETDNRAIIIFLTGSMEHMPDAFSCHAFDYIEKPATRNRIFKVLADARLVLPKVENNLTFNYNGVDIRIRFADLIALSTSGHYTRVIANNNQHYLPYISFVKITEPLNADRRFLQINKCILVNMDYVVKFENRNCHMSDGTILQVNTRNYKNIEQTWRNYVFTQLHHELNERSTT